MAIDPSGRGKDETAYAIVKILHGRLFLVAEGGFLGGYEEATLKGLLEIAKKHNTKIATVEPNYGGGMFTQLLRGAAQKYYDIRIEDADWSTVSKEQRIVDILEPVLNQHRLVVCPSVIQADYESVKDRDGERQPYYRLFYQLARMVRAKGALAQDDRLDALALAVAYWIKHLSRDTDKAVIDHKEAEFEKELQKFMKGALGGQQQPQRRWASQTARKALSGLGKTPH